MMKSLNKKIVILAVLILANVSFAGTYSGGSGSEALPYKIGTLGDWQELMTTSLDWDKHFMLTEDLNFNGLSLTPVGNGSTPFSGVFNGQNHVISNFVINLPADNYVGLFGRFESYSSGAKIYNLGLEGVNITGKGHVGGLAGKVSGVQIISSCYATGTVSGYSSVGGLLGSVSSSSISYCYAAGTVSGDRDIGDENVGGLVGYAYTSPITFCYSTSTVSGHSEVGGLVAYTDGSVTSCFWDAETSGLNYSAGGVGLSTAIMQNSEAYLRAFWDFKGEIKNGTNDTWAMPQGGGYPVLAWQLDESPLSNDEMGNAIAVTVGSTVSATSVGATGLDLTRNGYDDLADVWYYFDCTSVGKYTITVEPDGFDSTMAVFDERQTEIVFNDDFFSGKSVVILKAASGRRYYIRVAGNDGQTGNFALTVEQGAVEAIQADFNYDGMVNLVDFAIFAGQWLEGTSGG